MFCLTTGNNTKIQADDFKILILPNYTTIRSYSYSYRVALKGQEEDFRSRHHASCPNSHKGWPSEATCITNTNTTEVTPDFDFHKDFAEQN